jgi:hypothetical protein
MTHMRMPSELVNSRAKKVHRAASSEPGYFFSLSRITAIHFLSSKGIAVPGDYVDPWTVFPPRVMRQVDYGIRLGLQCNVVEFFGNDSHERVGALLHLYIEDRMDIGFYAVRL